MPVLRPRTLPALLFLAAALGPIATATAAAPVAQFEQINRASGAQGAAPGGNVSSPGFVTNDGRYATFGVHHFQSTLPATGWLNAPPLTTPSLPDGIYYRDLVADTTRRIALGSAAVTGIDNSDHMIGYISDKSYDRADTNGKPDLYAYIPGPGIRILLSRANGYRGAATGITSGGTITAGARFAIFGTPDGIFRRDILRGTTTKLGDGTFTTQEDQTIGGLGFDSPPMSRVSGDGKVVLTDKGIITPEGLLPLPAPAPDQPSDLLTLDTPRLVIAEDGKTAVYSTSFDAHWTRILDLATGKISTPALDEAASARFTPNPATFSAGIVTQLSPDGKTGIVSTFDGYDAHGTPITKLLHWDFTTGEVRDLYPHQAVASRNFKYAVMTNITGVSPGTVRAVVPLSGGTLPGTVDPPAADAYAEVGDVCEVKYENSQMVLRRQVSFITLFDEALPPAASAQLKGYDASGRLVVDSTAVNGPSQGDASQPQIFSGEISDDAYSFDIITKLVDGRTVSTHTNVAARVFPDCPYGGANPIPDLPTAQ